MNLLNIISDLVVIAMCIWYLFSCYTRMKTFENELENLKTDVKILKILKGRKIDSITVMSNGEEVKKINVSEEEDNQI